MASEKVKAKSVQEFIVTKTFCGAKGDIHKAGEVVHFKTKKMQAHMVGLGYVEPVKAAKPVRKETKPQSKK